MSSIRLNGQYVLIKDIEKKDFAAFVNLVLPKIQPTGSIPHLAANVLAELLAEGKAQTDPLAQAGFEICASLGVKNMWIDGATANVTEETPTDAAAGLETAFGFAAIQSGLALGGAMCNAFRRVVKVNEQEVLVVRQSREDMMKVAQMASNMKNVNEPIFITAGRLLGSRMKEGKTFADAELMAVLCMVSDLGATAIRIDLEAGTLGFGQFSTANAMASAILQGLDAEKLKQVRESVHNINEQFRRATEKQQGGNAGKSQQQQLQVPSVMGTRRRR